MSFLWKIYYFLYSVASILFESRFPLKFWLGILALLQAAVYGRIRLLSFALLYRASLFCWLLTQNLVSSHHFYDPTSSTIECWRLWKVRLCSMKLVNFCIEILPWNCFYIKGPKNKSCLFFTTEKWVHIRAGARSKTLEGQ